MSFKKRHEETKEKNRQKKATKESEKSLSKPVDLLISSKFQEILFWIGAKFYKNLKKLIYLPIILFLFACGIYLYNYFTLGTFFPKDFTLEGGLKITTAYNPNLEKAFYNEFVKDYGNSLKMEKLNNNLVITIVGSNYDLKKIKEFLNNKNVDYNLEEISPLLGRDFLKNLFKTILFSFVFVIIVMKLVYKKWDLALSAGRALFFNIFITLAISTLFIPLSITTLPAYLMILGYGIDTNIALINSMLKERKLEKIRRYQLAFNTGLTMDLTTLVVLFVGILLANNLIFKNIFFVLMIGLLVDIVDTWILNGYLVDKIVKH
jgi:preprotein translocase subunit SecF